MTKTVYFLIQGQFGNNLFQYFAAEIMKKIYNYDEVKPTFHINLEFNTVIDDDKFKTIITRYIANNTAEIDTSKDILLMGFFQRSEIFEYEREYIKSLFNDTNTNHISNRITIANIVKYRTKHTIQPTKNDLTLHLRCEDFWDKENNKSQIFHPLYIKDIIKTIKYDKLFIVADKADSSQVKREMDREWEKEYYKQFEDLNPIWINGNLGDDFDFLMKSNQIITSASTMSYMAAYLGNAENIHIPYNVYYGGSVGNGQHLGSFNDKCTMHYEDAYWFPSA